MRRASGLQRNSSPMLARPACPSSFIVWETLARIQGQGRAIFKIFTRDFSLAIMKMGYYSDPIVSAQINTLPVDMAIQQILSIYRMGSDAHGTIHHIYDETSRLSFEQIIRTMHQMDIKALSSFGRRMAGEVGVASSG